MAQPTDPSFGSSFSAETFRNAIKQTMKMATPNAVDERVTFIWPGTADYVIENHAGRPFDYAFETPTATTSNESKQVDCAVEFVSKASDETAIGEFDHPRIVVTLLDEDYEEVKTASELSINNNEYVINFVAPPMGLFTVTVYQIHATAKDLS